MTSYPQDVDNFMVLHFTTRVRRLIPYFLGGLGVALMLGGVAINYYKSSQNNAGVVESEDRVGTVAGELNTKMIKVDISGAVERPGVYELPYDSRVEDVLITAGGLAAKADRTYLSKNINLAQRLTDGMKVYIPEIGLASISNSSNSTNLSNLININNASESELDTLSGVGPVTADKIITSRPYQNILELVDRKVVSKSVFDKIKDRITVY